MKSLLSLTLLLCLSLTSAALGQEIRTPLFQGRTAADWGRLLSDRSPSIRATAANALRKMGENATPALGPLTQALHDGDQRVVEDAIWALGLIGKDAASSVSHLAGIVAQKEHPARITATVAIGLIGSSQSVALPVLGAAAKDDDPDLRSAAALALGAIGWETDAVLPALTQLTKDPESEVRHSAVLALGRLGARAKPAVGAVKALETDPDPAVKRDAKLALARIEGKPFEFEKVGRQPAVPVSSTASGTQPAPAVLKPVLKPDQTASQSGNASQTAANRVPPAVTPVSTTTKPETTWPEVAKTGGTSFPPARTEHASPVVVRPLQILTREKPRYTEQATRHKVAGDIVLSVQFKADGTVGEVTVLKGLGFGLDESAVQTARNIKFIPAERDGRPIDTISKVQYSFVQID